MDRKSEFFSSFSEKELDALEKIESFCGGVVLTPRGFESLGKPVKKQADREKINILLQSLCEKTIDQIEGEARRFEGRTGGIPSIAPMYKMELVDARLSQIPANQHDYEIFGNLKIPYESRPDTNTLQRVDGIILEIEGKTARRLEASTMGQNMLKNIKDAIREKAARYREGANNALQRISQECSLEPHKVHERLTDWLLENFPSSMIPEDVRGGKALSINCIVSGSGKDKVYTPKEILGFVDPLTGLECKKTIYQDPALSIADVKSISNDPNEIAITHIDMNNLPDGDTPAWDEQRDKFSDEEWAVFCAYVYATFDIKNNSRQILCFLDNGHTGKSVLMNTIAWAIGAGNWCAPDALQSNKSDKFYMSQFYGRHVVVIPDCKNPQVIRQQWVKQVSGGDVASIQFKGKDAFMAKVYAKIYLAMNEAPQVDTDADYIRTRLIILQPTLTEKALERLGERDENGEFVRDANGEVELKGDPNFEQNLKDEFWCFLKKCKVYYDRLCPDGCTIRLPKSVRQNLDVAASIETEDILEKCKEKFDFSPDYKITMSDFKRIITDPMMFNYDADTSKILEVLKTNRKVKFSRAVRTKTGQITTGLLGIKEHEMTPEEFSLELEETLGRGDSFSVFNPMNFPKIEF